MFDPSMFKERLWQARTAKDITGAAFVIGLVLCRHAGRKGACWPSLETLAESSGYSVKTAQRAVQDLKDAGLLDWRARWQRWNRRDSNLYTLISSAERHFAKEKSILRGSRVVLSIGSLSEAKRAAAERLAAYHGCTVGRLLPWLTPAEVAN